jgi:3-carboxy-cis,cis-muconate cycloisomerase
MTSAFEGFLSTPEMLEVFGAPAVVQAMLDFEAALARAEGAEGVIPDAAAATIAGACQAALLDVPGIVAASGRAGSLAIPLVKRLTEAVAQRDAEAAQWVHWGATSQDVIDTAMVLVTRRALALIDRDLGTLIDALLALAQAHRGTPVIGRTLMQPASVVSFGWKAAGWAQALVRGRARLHEAGARALQLQLGGAVGTLATLGDRGDAVAARAASLLGLPAPPQPWHVLRDDWAALGCSVGVLAGSLAKVARDVSLMAQAEVGELAEPSGAGRGGSTALPHKRNPVASMVALAAAHRVPHRVAALLGAMAPEHERGLGSWQAELAEWAGLFTSVHGATKALADAAPGLQVDAARMRANIDALRGLASAEAASMRVAQVVGKPRAQALLESLSQRVVAESRPLADLLRDAVAADAALRGALGARDIDTLFDPQVAALNAALRCDEMLQRLRPQAATLSAARPWRSALPPDTTTTEVLA